MRQAAVACRTLPVSMAAPTAARGASDVLSPRCDGSKNGASCGLLVVCSCHRGRPRHLDATGRARSELRSRAMDVVLQTFSSVRCNRRRSSDGGCAGRPERTDELRTCSHGKMVRVTCLSPTKSYSYCSLALARMENLIFNLRTTILLLGTIFGQTYKSTNKRYN